MEEKVRTVNMQTFNADVRSVRTRYMRARFGSCGRRGQIAINTALLFVPEPLLDYVIVHELAHIGHSNHSQHFWQSVGSMIPDYKIRSKQLKRYRLPEA
jgi:predicted metal-dependent hydrolase